MTPRRMFAFVASAIGIAALLLVGGISALPKDEVRRTGAQEIHPRRATLLSQAGEQAAVLASAEARPGLFAVWHVEFDSPQACRDFHVNGVYPLVRFQKWADVLMRLEDGKVPASLVKEVESAKGFVWQDLASQTQVPPPRQIVPVEKTRELGESIVRGGVGELKGQGVIVAVVDSGIDFRHPDFINYDEAGKPTSRVLYFWDTVSDNYANGVGRPGPFSFPTGAPIGTLYARDDLTAELRGMRHRINVWDPNGHGTACAGIAAGNGNGGGKDNTRKKQHQGVAPEADVIAIRVGDRDDLRHTALLGAICDWLERVGAQEKKPIVISCSYGGQHGGRDGSNVMERQLDARFGPDVKGSWCRAICIAAGNEGEFALHALLNVGGENAKGTLKWRRAGSVLSVYFDTKDLSDVRLASAGPWTAAEEQAQSITFTHGITRNAVFKTTLPGPGELTLYSRSGKMMKVHAYLDGMPARAEFDASCAVPSSQIASPATAAQAITVGSYDFNSAFHWLGQELSFSVSRKERNASTYDQKTMTIGALSSYSNPGPRRQEGDGVIKPDLAAPGQYHSAAAALNTEAWRDSSGLYRRFNGTSAATPYTAGVVALMLQKNKNLTNQQIKALLAMHATKKDRDGNPLDRRGWGNGKLDLSAVSTILKQIPAP